MSDDRAGDRDDRDDDQEDNQDDQDELPRFDYIVRVDGSRYLRIHTENVDYLVKVRRDDLDRLRERLDEPPNIA